MAASRAGGAGPAVGVPQAEPGPGLMYSQVLQHLVGEKRQPRALSTAVLGGLQPPHKSQEQKMVERAMESCGFKATLACVGGFVLGGAFGIFTAGIDTNVGFDAKDPLRTPTAREVLRDMGQRGMSYAKNFAIVGAMFSCTECIVESLVSRQARLDVVALLPFLQSSITTCDDVTSERPGQARGGVMGWGRGHHRQPCRLQPHLPTAIQPPHWCKPGTVHKNKVTGLSKDCAHGKMCLL
uniref:mitochondrial import inner membrane translocase subunit Tim22 isoform X1 n=1 Tax=Pristiophorus japonicus TaxID=55135 RepID=UPI00398F41D3